MPRWRVLARRCLVAEQHLDFDLAVLRRLAPHPSPCFRGAAVTSPVSACDCHLSPRPRPRDLPDPNCPRCLGSGEVTCG